MEGRVGEREEGRVIEREEERIPLVHDDNWESVVVEETLSEEEEKERVWFLVMYVYSISSSFIHSFANNAVIMTPAARAQQVRTNKAASQRSSTESSTQRTTRQSSQMTCPTSNGAVSTT